MRTNPPTRHASRSVRTTRVKAAAVTVIGVVTALVVSAITSEGAVLAFTIPHV